MAQDDRRMHGGNTPGLVAGRGHEHGETPVRPGDREPGAEPDPTADAETPRGRVADATDGAGQPSALGGDVATRSGTAPTPKDEQ